MADAYNDGILSEFSIRNPEVIGDISAFLVTMFVPETPLYSWLRNRGQASTVGSTSFSWLNSKTRPRTGTVGTGGIDSSSTSLPVTDASVYMVGDELLIGTEYLTVTADPVVSTSPETVTVRRGAAGSTAASHSAAAVITLLTNTRTGGEVNQSAIRNKRTSTTQFCQTWQFPVQVSGSAAADTNIVLPAGVRDLFTSNQVEALRNMKRDIENSIYYAPGEDATASNPRPIMKGLKTLISTNLTTAPVNSAAYTPADFIRDGTQKCRDGGGEPSLCLVSTGWQSGLAKWGMQVERVQVGETQLGTPIEGFIVPFLGRFPFLEAQQLGSATNHTFVMLTADEVYWRYKRNEFWNPRGNRGDVKEGEYIGEGAVQLVNEPHHAWVEGITGFAAA